MNLEIACLHLATMEHTELIAKSSVLVTQPWGKTDQPDFCNMAVLLDTTVKVGELMQNILSVEKLMGRVREEKWGPRIIDIDIILYGEEIVNTPEVVVPHPYMTERRFVLEPANEIAGFMNHPLLNKTVGELLAISSNSKPEPAK